MSSSPAEADLYSGKELWRIGIPDKTAGGRYNFPVITGDIFTESMQGNLGMVLKGT